MTRSTKRALWQVQMMEYGFGPDIMRLTKVCPHCGRGNPAANTACTDCGGALGEQTLLDLYRSRHPCCPDCGIAVRNATLYCPECGARIRHGEAVV